MENLRPIVAPPSNHPASETGAATPDAGRTEPRLATVWPGTPYPLGAAYDGAGSHLSPLADQEITAFLLWAVAGVCFIPVIFVTLLTWLKEGGEEAGEPDLPTVPAGVRGWGGSARQGRRRHGSGQ